MSSVKLQSVIADAIRQADTSYFNENYSKQAAAVLTALEKAGFAIIAGDMTDTVAAQVAREMRTGRVKPEDHVKDVYQTALRVLRQGG